MANIKEYNVKLSSLKNTRKMTRTMKLISMSKLYQAQENQRNAKNYVQKITSLINRVAQAVPETTNPLLQIRPQIKNALILVVTSDRGLCGGFNNNIIKSVNRWMKEQSSHYQQIQLAFCGKRGFFAFKRYPHIFKNYEHVTAKPSFLDAIRIGRELSESFLTGQVDEVYVAYNTYHSPLSQTVLFDRILPIKREEIIEEQQSAGEYIFEPVQDVLLEGLVPKYLYFRIFFALLENSAGEHGARMTAMDNATKNTEELIEHYTLLRNRARQSAITTELIEIISGAEALK